MANAKTKAKSPVEGLWHIDSMSEWDEDYFNEEVQAFIELEANGTGHFQFGYVQGYMDWRPGTRDGTGYMDDLHGRIVIHLGDESDFVATRAKAPKRPKRK